MPALTESSQRPAYMPGAKDEGFLPRITQRGSSSDSDSVAEYKKGLNGRTLSSGTTSSTSSSPIKLPAINGKSKSNSVSSLQSNGISPTRARDEHRSTLCRSPSCPSNIGFWYEKDGDHDTPTPVDQNTYHLPKRDSADFKLPDINDRNSMCSGASQSTVRSLSTQRSPTKNRTCRESSPIRRDRSVSLTFSRDNVQDPPTPRPEPPPDSQRSNTQSALLLPIRNSESRLSVKKKKKKKRQSSRQNTEISIKSENTVIDEGTSERMDSVRNRMEAIDSRGYFSDAEAVGMSDDRFITQVKEENVVCKGRDSVVSVNKRHKLKKRMTDNGLYFERELTQVKG